MSNKKIIFSGFMAAILLGYGANAAQIASKEYVDAIDNAIRTDISNTYATTTNVTNIVNEAIDEAVEGITGDISDMATMTWVEDQGYATTGAMTGYLAGKADKVTTATAGNLAGLDGNGNLTDSGISGTDVSAMGDAITVIEGAITTIEGDITSIEGDINTIEGNITNLTTTVNSKADASDLSGKEDTSNKVASISANTGSTTKFPTVSAVEGYAVPKPTANCLGTQAQCVLAIDKSDGTIYWEDVAVPAQP